MADRTINSRANESSEVAKNLPASVQYAICQVLPNIGNGAFWGFTDMRDVKNHLEALRSDKNITVRKLNNDRCLLEVEPSYLVRAVQQVDSGAIVQKDIQEIQTAMVKAKMEFEKFLITKGKSQEGFGGTIGIYCVNDTPVISYKGTSYPAFRLSMGDVLNFLDAYGYQIKVKGQFMPASSAAQSGQALWDSIVLSPTKTGVFVDIKATYSSAQYKSLEQQYKAKYNIK